MGSSAMLLPFIGQGLLDAIFPGLSHDTKEEYLSYFNHARLAQAAVPAVQFNLQLKRDLKKVMMTRHALSQSEVDEICADCLPSK